MTLDILKIFGPVVIGASLMGTILVSVILLPLHFFRKKLYPNNHKHTILKIIVLSFFAFIAIGLIFLFSFVGVYSIEEGSSKDDSAIMESDNKGYTQIDMERAKTIFEVPGDYIILDVRRVNEFAEGHIPEAINVSNDDIVDTELAELPDKKQTIYVYCRSGIRSKQAAQKLVDIGYENVIDIGGIIEWTGDIEK